MPSRTVYQKIIDAAAKHLPLRLSARDVDALSRDHAISSRAEQDAFSIVEDTKPAFVTVGAARFENKVEKTEIVNFWRNKK